MEILVKSPVFSPADRRRSGELAKLAKDAARQIVIAFVESGWRESEVALCLADVFEDYCLYLAERSSASLKAANGNTAGDARVAN